MGEEKKTGSVKKMTFKKFLKTYRKEELYAVQYLVRKTHDGLWLRRHTLSLMYLYVVRVHACMLLMYLYVVRI